MADHRTRLDASVHSMERTRPFVAVTIEYCRSRSIGFATPTGDEDGRMRSPPSTVPRTPNGAAFVSMGSNTVRSTPRSRLAEKYR